MICHVYLFGASTLFRNLQLISTPFILSSDAVDYSRVSGTWVGEIKKENLGQWFDGFGIVILGGIPWQVVRKYLI